jgi:hypothetical protein
MAGAIRSMLCAAGAALVVAAGAQAATAGIPSSCPPASTVASTLGTTASTPTKTHTTYTLTCKYGSSALAPKVEFQVDTSSTFAAGEKAAGAAVPIVKVPHLGKAAWATKSGGSLYVFNGSYTIKLLALLTPLPKLEALAKKLL